MLSFEEVIGRVKDILSEDIGEKRVLDKDVADALGISAAYFAVLKKRGSLPLKHIADFCAVKKISINWLLYDQAPKSLEESTEKYATVRYFKQITISAGGGSVNWEESFDRMRIADEYIELLGGRGKLKHIDVLEIKGDSMEPLLRDKELVAIDRSKTVVKDGRVYALRVEDELFVKQVQFDKASNEIICISLNSAYSSMRFDICEVEVIGEAVAVMAKDT